jgi:hypothetical protein
LLEEILSKEKGGILVSKKEREKKTNFQKKKKRKRNAKPVSRKKEKKKRKRTPFLLHVKCHHETSTISFLNLLSPLNSPM